MAFDEIDYKKMDRLVREMARRKTFERFNRAVERGIINACQAEALMRMWEEDHALDD